MIRRHVLPAAFALLLAGPALAAEAEWPCVQIKVPELSPGTMWAGPPLDEASKTWKDDQAVVDLVRQTAPRRVPIADATKLIGTFADGLMADRTLRLTRLFVGLLETIDAERKDIMAGIERYAGKQVSLADKIKAETAEGDALRDKAVPTDAERARAGDIDRQLEWDIRIFEERTQSLRYVCESPVLLEQRMFALARAIMEHLE